VERRHENERDIAKGGGAAGKGQERYKYSRKNGLIFCRNKARDVKNQKWKQGKMENIAKQSEDDKEYGRRKASSDRNMASGGWKARKIAEGGLKG
jgi:hypothetical protein